MGRVELDWSYLGGWLTVPLAALGVALVVLTASYVARARYDAAAASQAARLQTLDEQRADLAGRLQARREYHSRFEALASAGVIGPEQRLGWAKALRSAAESLHLPYLRYTAAPQAPFEAGYLDPALAAPVMASTMELQTGLVHEVDLLRLFARLHRQAPGLFGVTGCSLERTSADAAPQPEKANITSTCELRWFTIPLSPADTAEDAAT